MISFSHNLRVFSIRLDWFAFGATKSMLTVSDLDDIREFFSRFFVGKWGSGGAFYEQGYRFDCGVLYLQKKENNRNLPIAIELFGAFFENRESDFDVILRFFYEKGFSINPYRIDTCCDLRMPIDRGEITGKSSFMPVVYFFDGQKECTGFACGKGDFRYRLYDKQTERSSHGIEVSGDWWRFEVQARGEGLKNQFKFLPFVDIFYSDFLLLGVVMLGSRKKVDMWPECFQDACVFIAEGKLEAFKRKKETSYKAALDWFFGRVRREFLRYSRRLEMRFAVECKFVPDDTPSDVLRVLEAWDADDFYSERGELPLAGLRRVGVEDVE